MAADQTITPTSSYTVYQRRLQSLFIWLSAAIPLVALVAPLALAALLVIAAVVAVLIGSWREICDSVPRRPAVLAGLFLVWALGSAAWSIEPAGSITKFGQIAVLFAAGLVLLGASRTALPPDTWTKAGLSLAVAIGIVLVIFVIEYLLEAPLARALNGDTDYGLHWQMTRHNRAATVVAIAFIPASLALAFHAGRTTAITFIVLVIGTLSLLQSRTAVASAVLATGVALIALYWLVFARAVVIVATVAAIALAPYLPTILPSDAEAVSEIRVEAQRYNVFSVFHRFRIWEFAVERIDERPILGWGLNTSRHVPGGKVVSDGGGELMSLHPHNAPLQIRLELGIPGVLLLGALVLWSLLSVPRASFRSGISAAVLSVAMACLTIGSMSYGIWQSWWLATLWLAAAVIVPAASSPLPPRT